MFGDGKAILEVGADVTQERVAEIREVWRAWVAGPGAQLLVVPAPVVLEVGIVDGELVVYRNAGAEVRA